MGDSTSVATHSAIASMLHMKTQMAMLHDDVQVVVHGTIEQLNWTKRDVSRVVLSML